MKPWTLVSPEGTVYVVDHVLTAQMNSLVYAKLEYAKQILNIKSGTASEKGLKYLLTIGMNGDRIYGSGDELAEDADISVSTMNRLLSNMKKNKFIFMIAHRQRELDDSLKFTLPRASATFTTASVVGYKHEVKQ